MIKDLITLSIVPLVPIAVAIIVRYQTIKAKKIDKDIEKLRTDFNERFEKIKSDLLIEQKMKMDSVSFITEDKKNKLNALKELTESLQIIKDDVINVALNSVPSSLSKKSFEPIIEQNVELLIKVYAKNISFFDKHQKEILHPSKEASNKLRALLFNDKYYHDGYLIVDSNLTQDLLSTKSKFTEFQNRITDFKVDIISI